MSSDPVHSALAPLDRALVWLPGDDHGLDVADTGEGAVDEPRMYQLVRQRRPRPRTVEITFDAPGVRAYVFTFG